ncbi:MAG: hypothetical protein HYX86_05205 [Chloroflexi bacterium]|nr:hypothetical protein [Chloroflexota bacterium]
MSTKLQIVVEPRCAFCPQAITLGQQAKSHFPDLEVEILDLAQQGTQRPEQVVAVPTFLLNGEVISLGNPSALRLFQKIEEKMMNTGFQA